MFPYNFDVQILRPTHIKITILIFSWLNVRNSHKRLICSLTILLSVDLHYPYVGNDVNVRKGFIMKQFHRLIATTQLCWWRFISFHRFHGQNVFKVKWINVIILTGNWNVIWRNFIEQTWLFTSKRGNFYFRGVTKINSTVNAIFFVYISL